MVKIKDTDWRNPGKIPAPPKSEKELMSIAIFDATNSGMINRIVTTYGSVCGLVFDKICCKNKTNASMVEYDTMILKELHYCDITFIRLLIEKTYQEYNKHKADYWVKKETKLVSCMEPDPERNSVCNTDLTKGVLQELYYMLEVKCHSNSDDYSESDVLPVSLDYMQTTTDFLINCKTSYETLDSNLVTIQDILKTQPEYVLECIYVYMTSLKSKIGDTDISEESKRVLDRILDKQYYNELSNIIRIVGEHLQSIKTDNGTGKSRV